LETPPLPKIKKKQEINPQKKKKKKKKKKYIAVQLTKLVFIEYSRVNCEHTDYGYLKRGCRGIIWTSESGSNSRLEKSCNQNVIRQNKSMCLRLVGNIECGTVNVRNAYYLTGKKRKIKQEIPGICGRIISKLI